MNDLDAVRRVIAIAAAAVVAVACGGGQAPLDQRPAEVTRLEGVVPIVEELRVTDFENSARCRNLAYARGAFGDLEDEGCEREDTVPFDAPALADHERLAESIDATGVATDRILVATFDADDRLETAWFSLEEDSIADNWDYLYDPGGVEPKQNVTGRQTFTRVDDDWWLVWSRDD